MLNTLRKILTSALPHPAGVVGVVPQDSGALRNSLCVAQAVRAKAESDVAETEAALKRVEGPVDVAAQAERAATGAELEVRRVAAEWARNGAPSNIPPVSNELKEKARSARLAAIEAGAVAEGVEDGLPALREAHRRAQHALNSARSKVTTAVGDVILQELEPIRDRAERSRTEYLAMMRVLHAAHEPFRSYWGEAHQWASIKCPAGAVIQTWIGDLAISEKAPARSETERHERHLEILPDAKPWADFARRLASDADAEF